MSDIYTHTTSLENLTRILDGSRHIMALRHLARTSPDTEVSVEPLPMPIRRRMKAGDAYERMRGVKDTDRVFLSHRGWLPNYGDAVVVKRLSPRSVVRGERLNSIPEEYTTGRALSLRSNADVYVPDEVLEEFRAKYPSIRFRGRSTLPRSALQPVQKTAGRGAWTEECLFLVRSQMTAIMYTLFKNYQKHHYEHKNR